MKIVEIKGRVLKVPRFPYCWRDGFPRAPAEPDGFLLQVIAENALRMGSKATVSPRGAAKCWDGRPRSLLKLLMVGENGLECE